MCGKDRSDSQQRLVLWSCEHGIEPEISGPDSNVDVYSQLLG